MSERNSDVRKASLLGSALKMRQSIAQITKAGVLYFAIVFGAGFVLGTIRTLWVVPRVGTRTAESMEAPIMLVVTIVAARWIVLRLAVPDRGSARLGMGGIALGLLLFAEFGPVLWLRGISLKEYLATRDPVSGTVYYLMLGLFGLMPLLVARSVPSFSAERREYLSSTKLPAADH